MIYAIVAAAETEHPRGCMLGNTATELHTDATATTIVHEAFVELETAVAHALTRAQADGEVTDEIDPGTYAPVLVALMQGLHVMTRVETDPLRLRAAVDAALAPLASNPS
jgi:TetR/AcrR family transcriptional repressor of nem operon